ncbi:flavin reductase family protein [Rhizobium sp. CF142]|uniref:flavin reductase family protein n=1 Tax=Rhizobium sp. CF142 TaxID=1144314 RepID=UPI00026EEC2E|nr:flavin reductase family protein [Rhizobium sp. CF142]EJJ26713.1 DIM6/NTAB-family protein [Rhizobium sp. CF142]
MSVSVQDSRALRDAFGTYASGLTVIAGLVEGAPVGFTCQSFCSVSLEPPLVSFCVMKSSSSWPKLRPAGAFTINILSAGQMETCRNFGRSGVDRWAGVEWGASKQGHPVMQDALLCLDCSTYAEHEAGDHWLVLARVEDVIHPRQDADRAPLLFYRGNYHFLNSAVA